MKHRLLCSPQVAGLLFAPLDLAREEATISGIGSGGPVSIIPPQCFKRAEEVRE